TSHHRWFGLRPVLALALVIVIAGCDGTTSVPEPAPEDAAKATLETALNAWQKGESVAAMKAASPSITVADPKWEKGQKLTKYEVLRRGEPSGAERVFQVKLWLSDSGKESQESVAYRVGTQPIRTVFRALF